jgi:type I restriction enzyme S subunit
MVPLRAIYQRVELRGRAELPLLSVYRDHGVVPRDERDDNNNRPSEDLSTYKYVRPGDLVVNKMKTWQGSLAVSGHEGIVSPAYFVGRRVSDVDDRFMHHLLRSMPLIAEYGARSKGIRPSQWDLPWDEFAAIKVSLPSASKQRAIADYLDTETARIDALIAKKQRMIELVEERTSALVEQEVRALSAEHGATPLKHRTTAVQVGIVVTPSVWYSEQGVLALRGVNVRPGGINLDDVVRLNEKGHALNRKSVLRAGDVVVVRTGQAGAAAVVPAKLDGVNCIDLLIVRPASDLLPRFLEYVVNSDWTQKHILEHSVGSIQGHFNVGSLKELPVPMSPPSAQAEMVSYLDRCTTRLAAAKDRLSRQVERLREHRQALITAAVTGELEVPGVAA